MKALREWLIKQSWFILRCDPTPSTWSIWALSPSGEILSFVGNEEEVTGWDSLRRLSMK
jgi:hypothetical protein